ncbi:hypothetical protein CES85_5023 [Ochrobactrum quorumnocens]|uniref:Uncharacterized protein n=1 Tax=Ochrobactrum quorumnocens TaxID=271865 RepID=A0A248UCX5_9HYPH|nr:hypothetical protein CES85_5023 [[Ochrobactrum] quorumnocens]
MSIVAPVNYNAKEPNFISRASATAGYDPTTFNAGSPEKAPILRRILRKD